MKALKLFLILFSLTTTGLFAQPWNIGTNFTFSWDETNNNDKIEAVGVGDYSANGDLPQYGLDVHMPYLFSNGLLSNLGNSFHTCAGPDYYQFWYMTTHGVPDSNKFYIMNPPSYPHNMILSVVQRGDMDFYTNNTHWMRLEDDGRLGLSDRFGSMSYGPSGLFGLDRGGNSSVYQRFSSGRTGFSSTDGFQLGITDDGTGSIASLIQNENYPMILYTGAPNGILRERLRLSNGNGGNNAGGFTTAGVTRISISHDGTGSNYLPQPVAMLNLGASDPNPPTNQAGDRPWMDVGMYMNYGTDNMYIGLKDTVGANLKDAIINWGDDIDGNTDHDAEVLRFMFTGYNYNSANNDLYDHNSVQGLEVARMTPRGRMGVGAGFSRVKVPKARMDIFDDGSNHTTYSSGTYSTVPQLRLTQQLSTTSTGGRWTDLTTTFSGDLYINPHDDNLSTSADRSRFVGISTNTPHEKLEINSNDASATINGGNSGLIFTDLTTASTPGNNVTFAGGTDYGVLSVNSSGKVVLVKDQTATVASGLNECAATIPDNYILRMSNTSTNEICTSDIYNDYANHTVGISNTSPAQKLDVNGDINIPMANAYYINHYPFLYTNPNGSDDIMLGYSSGPTSSTHTSQYSIFVGTDAGHSIAYNEIFNTFVGTRAGYNTAATSGSSNDAIKNVYVGSKAGEGASANAHGMNNTFIGFNAGGNYSHLGESNGNTIVGCESGNQGNDVGQHNTLLGYDSHVNNTGGGAVDNAVVIGYNINTTSDDAFVCGNATNQILMGYTATPTSVSAGTFSATDCRLYVTPRIGSYDAAFFNGNVLCSAAFQSSDSTLKTNIQPLDEQFANSVLNSLSPKSYEFDIAGNPSLSLASGTQYGLLAQDVEAILPGLVREVTAPPIVDAVGSTVVPEKTYKALNYTGLIPFLIQSLKSQQARIDQLEAIVNNCCNMNPVQRTAAPAIDVELSNSVILLQNDPNPFAEETKIMFNIPETVGEAKIIFTDNSNHIIQTVKINERGNGQLNVYASNLSSGTYIYTLIADGKVVASKRMVCTK